MTVYFTEGESAEEATCYFLTLSILDGWSLLYTLMTTVIRYTAIPARPSKQCFSFADA